MIHGAFKLVRLGVTAALLVAISTTTDLAQEGAGPRLLEAVAPAYPMLAIYSAAAGKVTVRVEIDRSGSVRRTQAITGHQLLRLAAENAAKQWRFAGSASVVEFEVFFSFKIMPKNTPELDLATRFMPPYEIEIRRTVPEAMTNRDPAPTKLKR